MAKKLKKENLDKASGGFAFPGGEDYLASSLDHFNNFANLGTAMIDGSPREAVMETSVDTTTSSSSSSKHVNKHNVTVGGNASLAALKNSLG